MRGKAMVEAIKERLELIEKHNNISVLYACESGSRAWGFASPDSDYDVRFIYVRRLNDYLTIANRKDVIEVPVNELLDIGGWDIRKALQLFMKSNAPLYEWLQSPVIYKSHLPFTEEICSLIPSYFSLRAGCHHYLSMARNGYENDLQSSEVKLKKYFYALRSALAGLWIVENKQVPPMEFGRLRAMITDSTWQATVDELMEMKKVKDEKALIRQIPRLQGWMEHMLSKITEGAKELREVKHNTNELDDLFRKYIHSPSAR
jgi:uncharacterized protein